VTIIVFGAIFAGFGLGFESSDHISAFAAAFGVFAGSLLWWVTLSAGVALLSAKLGERLTRGSQRLSAFILMTFGIITSISAFRP
jgi:putative LysE/RhtB family amino acid efflux pump